MIRFCIERVTHEPNGERVVRRHTLDLKVPELQAELEQWTRTEKGDLTEHTKLVWAEPLDGNRNPKEL